MWNQIYKKKRDSTWVHSRNPNMLAPFCRLASESLGPLRGRQLFCLPTDLGLDVEILRKSWGNIVLCYIGKSSHFTSNFLVLRCVTCF